MKIGPIILILWGLTALVSIFVVPIAGVRRHGFRRGFRTLLAVPGAAMSFGPVMAWIGYTERAFSRTSPDDVAALALAVVVGLVGVVLQIIACRAALRPPIGPGCCQKCGYELKDLARCPECGRLAR